METTVRLQMNTWTTKNAEAHSLQDFSCDKNLGSYPSIIGLEQNIS